MKVARALALIAGTTAAFAVLLYLARYFGGALPFPLGIFLQIAAVGVPAFFGAGLAQREGLPQPPLLAAAAYCLGSGIATSVLMGGGEPASSYVTVALVHTVSLTVMVPAMGGGFMTFIMNPLWLVATYLIAREGVSAVCKARPAPENRTSAAEDPP